MLPSLVPWEIMDAMRITVWAVGRDLGLAGWLSRLARELELPINRTPDKSNFFLFPLKVRIIGSRLYIESDLKGNGNCFELAGGSSYRDSTVFTLYSLLFFSPFLKNIQEVEW